MPARGHSQKLLFEDPAFEPDRESTSSTFSDNMRLPVHRWFRYSAGFSAKWVEEVLKTAARSSDVTVLDPFAGAGTTLLAAERVGVAACGVEAQPFIARVARAKLLYRSDPEAYLRHAREVKRQAARLQGLDDGYPTLIHKCFDTPTLLHLDHLRRAWENLHDASPASELVWLTLVAILRPVSCAATAPWQYVLPRKTKKSPLDPGSAFDQMIHLFCADIRGAAEIAGPPAQLIEADARTCAGVPDGFANLIVTSPPYANNFDYADATRLEMCFLRQIKGWGDLQAKVRQRLVRSCSQHVPESTVHLEEVLSASELAPLREEITGVCGQLDRVRHERGGRKTYHLMVACYFLDIARVWLSLRRVCRRPSRACFVIGDSAPYGVYVPVIEWTGALARAAGFQSFAFEKTRDRNVKWKNRKHRVPLCEGRLWVEG